MNPNDPYPPDYQGFPQGEFAIPSAQFGDVPHAYGQPVSAPIPPATPPQVLPPAWAQAVPPPQVFWQNQPPPQPVVVQQRGVPFQHGPHILIDCITCGFWLPVHLLLWVLHRN